MGCLSEDEILFAIRVPMRRHMEFPRQLITVLESEGTMPAFGILGMLAVDGGRLVQIGANS